MATSEIRFDDGSAYERYMGRWSQLAGEQFLNWLAPEAALRWLDVGCGNGAFTEMIIERCLPASVHGVDPSQQQLTYARTRLPSAVAQFQRGDAMNLPFPNGSFDTAIMPLVIFFVPDPAKGVAEMVRAVGKDGTVAAYAWDMLDGGFPYDAVWKAMGEMGFAVPMPPSPQVSRMEALRELWMAAGLGAVQTLQITVERSFADFDEYWATILKGPSVSGQLATMGPEQLGHLQSLLRQRLSTDATGRITCMARANAVKGQVPA